jgi:hypothetical protein
VRKNKDTTNVLPNDLFDGTVGENQYNQWLAHFGGTLTSGSGSSTASAEPEPAAKLLLGTVPSAFLSPRGDRWSPRRVHACRLLSTSTS